MPQHIPSQYSTQVRISTYRAMDVLSIYPELTTELLSRTYTGLINFFTGFTEININCRSYKIRNHWLIFLKKDNDHMSVMAITNFMIPE